MGMVLPSSHFVMPFLPFGFHLGSVLYTSQFTHSKLSLDSIVTYGG